MSRFNWRTCLLLSSLTIGVNWLPLKFVEPILYRWFLFTLLCFEISMKLILVLVKCKLVDKRWSEPLRVIEKLLEKSKLLESILKRGLYISK